MPLTGLSPIIERTDKAVLFKKAGPEQVEIVAKTAGNRKRLAAAFETTEDKLYDEYFKRLANPQPLVEVPSGDAPVHEIKITGKDVDLTKLPFHPQHAYGRLLLLSSAIDYVIDPATGRRNVGCRRLSLRNRYESRHQCHRAVRPQAHLHRAAWRAARSCRSRSRSAPIRSTSLPRPRASPATSWRWSPASAASRRRWSKASPTTSWCRPTPR